MDVDQANEGYRSFARGAIAAVITINALALGAVLSQIAELQRVTNEGEVFTAFALWVVGVAVGVAAWVFAALAAQAYAVGVQRRESTMAQLGMLCIFASLACFSYGAWQIGTVAFAGDVQSETIEEAEEDVFTLYRNSVMNSQMRIHVATFDEVGSGTEYNRENCLIAASLFQDQPAVSVLYWCEAGRYQQGRE